MAVMDNKLTVLLVDDDKFLLEMYRKKFEQSNFEVTLAVGSEDALAKLRNGATPNILMLDVIMPTMDGIELLQTVRTEKLCPDAVVIMLTNESDHDRIEEAKALGINGYIVKATTIPSEVVDEVAKIAGLTLNKHT